MDVNNSLKANLFINTWLNHIENGDKLVFSNGKLTLYNGSNCELDSISIQYENARRTRRKTP